MPEHPDLHFSSQPSLRAPWLILAWTGWSDAGEAASHAARYLAGADDADAFAYIDAQEYYDFIETRPSARYVDGEREIIWPHTRFFALPQPNADHDLIIGVGAEPNFHWLSYMAALDALIRSLNVEFVISLAAVSAPVPHTRPVPVRGSANTPALADQYDMRPSQYEGTTGIVGVFHDHCRTQEINGVSLWASVPHYLPGILNPMGARALLESVQELTGVDVQYTDLTREMGRFHRQMTIAMRENENLATYVRQLEASRSDAAPGGGDPEAQPELPSAEGLISDLEAFLRRNRSEDASDDPDPEVTPS